MSERDQRRYYETKADPAKYAAYLARKRAAAKRRNEEGRKRANLGYDGRRKAAWRAANPEKNNRTRPAHWAVERALKSGKLIRSETCEKCGSGRLVQAHHHKGYDRAHWLDVIWLCIDCHAAEHHPR